MSDKIRFNDYITFKIYFFSMSYIIIFPFFCLLNCFNKKNDQILIKIYFHVKHSRRGESIACILIQKFEIYEIYFYDSMRLAKHSWHREESGKKFYGLIYGRHWQKKLYKMSSNETLILYENLLFQWQKLK